MSDSGKPQSVLFAAGGTGGHLFPAFAVAEALKKRLPEAEICFVGVGNQLELKLAKSFGFKHFCIAASPLRGLNFLGLIRFPFLVSRSLFSAFLLLRKIRPNVVVGFGGFPTVAPMLVGRILNIPLVLHEQNVAIGMANKLLSCMARKVFAPFGVKGFAKWINVHEVMNPVREVFTTIPQWSVPKEGQGWNLLIVGGSQGAVSLNSAVIELIPYFKERGIRVVHQTGTKDFERVMSAYADSGLLGTRCSAFVDNIAEAYAQADLVVCRAGAMTAAEVSAAGRAAIYIPLNIAGGHQRENVRVLAQQGAAVVLEQGPELAKQLRQVIDELISCPEKLLELSKNARSIGVGDLPSAEVIAEAICSAI